MTRSKAIARLVSVGRAQLDELVREPACIACTAIGIGALADLGIAAEPLSVEVTAVNQPYVQWDQEGRPGGPEELRRRGGYSVVCGLRDANPADFAPSLLPVDPAKAWDGHLVIRVGPLIVDMDLVAFDRPAQGLRVPPAGAFLWPNLDEPAGFRLSTGTVLGYRAKPEDRSFEQAKDWRLRHEVSSSVAAVVRAMRKGADCPRLRCRSLLAWTDMARPTR